MIFYDIVNALASLDLQVLKFYVRVTVHRNKFLCNETN